MDKNKVEHSQIIKDTLATIEQKKIGLLFLFPIAFCYILFINSMPIKTPEIILNTSTVAKSALYKVESYVVYSNKCKIPAMDPFNKDVINYIEKKNFIQCSKGHDLVYITKNENYTQAVMHVNNTIFRAVVCNVSTIVRIYLSDDDVKKVNSTVFTTNITLPANVPVVVHCTNKITNAEVFANTYYPILRNPKVDAKIKKIKTPFSVLIIGIDTLSRGEMIRSMPETWDFLKEHGWIDMLGYNKVGRNTFPNIMPLLAGRNSTFVTDGCDGDKAGGLNKCNFIWNDFSKFGFITLYMEGNSRMSTFNYQKRGFQHDPTDYYFRQYILAGGEFEESLYDDVQYCVGPISETERILNKMKEAAVVFKNDSTFSFYWMNHAHGEMNAAGRYDLKMKETLEVLESAGIFNDTIIIFMSDHGLRFGSSYVYTYPGQIEDRLPFFSIYFPERFRKDYPDKYKNVLRNTNKLITAYDVYMTLQEILFLVTESFKVKASMSCEKSLSLFSEIPHERSCEDVCIPPDYCLCNSFEPIDVKNETVQATARFIVKSIVGIFELNKNARKCARYKLDHVISSRMYIKSEEETQLLIVLKTIPGAIFESVITVKSSTTGDDRFSSSNDFSRLDKYGPHSNCVGGVFLKSLCYCEK